MDSGFSAPPPPLQGPFAQSQSNPQPIFGTYGENALLNQSLSFDFYSDSAGGFGFDDKHDEHTDLKRRRIAKACDACRRKKIKCDGQQPRCGHCQNYKTECIFTHVEKKRSPPKGAKYIEGLENRLGRMENLLKLTGLLSEDDVNGVDLKTLEQRLAQQSSPQMSDHSQVSNSYPHALSQHTSRSGQGTPNTSTHLPSPQSGASPAAVSEPKDGVILEPSQKKIDTQDVEQLSDLMCSLVTNNCGDTKFIGSSSGFSILSPKGIQWVNEKTGDDSFQKMISYAAANNTMWHHWRPDVFGDIFARRGPTRLPPKEETVSLTKEFFESFNIVFPLFHEPTFLWLVERQYSSDPYEGSGWWASLNVALAIAYRIRVVKNLNLGDDDNKAWAHFRNCLAVHSELTLRNTDLLSVQALIGMSLFMQGTPNPQPSFSLIGAAIRLMHSIGLHKRSAGFGLNKMESEQRKRVFWIGYLIDTEQSLRSGRPPLQDDNDWNVEMPAEEPEDGVGVVSTDDGEKINLFRKLCEFALISSKVYDRLYSVKASKQSDGELLNTIGELDKELESWKESFPRDFRPEHEPKSQDQALMLQMVTIHFGYYNCLTTIHRMSVHHGYWTSRLSEYAINGHNSKSLNPRVYISAALVVQAARASINLIKYIPQGDYACVWLILYYPVSALITLFANILQNPQDARAPADLKLMSVVVNFLSRICLEEESQSMRLTYSVTKEFERIANVVLNKAEREMNARQKRKQEQESNKIVDDSHSRQPDALNTSQKRSAEAMRAGSIEGARPTESSNGISCHNANQSPIASAGEDCGYPNGHAFVETHCNMSNGPITPEDSDISLVGQANSGINSTLLSEPSAFQQPFVPQDLWSIPMTFEWDWSDLGRLDEANPNGQTTVNGAPINSEYNLRGEPP